ncbi:MAG TPA: o-succinylbenzoate synthase [Chitinophagales bacterium]|nr:o-succinylbenzoate synthase [Chitinophagales bacterium]
MRASYKKYQLQFTRPVLTSRGAMQYKNGYYLVLSDGERTGIGECSFIEGLSIDDLNRYEDVLAMVSTALNEKRKVVSGLSGFPSIAFGLEMALADLKAGGKKLFFSSLFTDGKASIPINGLVWMGTKDFMLHQIEKKLQDGFKCIKVKVGAIDFADEISLLGFIRQKFPADVIEIRLDANGAFHASDVFKKLEALAAFNIHSIEQPVKQGQYDLMQKVCFESPIPVALDEELIAPVGISKTELLEVLKPQYLILKPSLLGGFGECNEWIELAEKRGLKWWATSALESNIGLNAIAQWAYTKNTTMVQGLGTGGLYTNNVSSPLYVTKGHLHFDPKARWGILPVIG